MGVDTHAAACLAPVPLQQRKLRRELLDTFGGIKILDNILEPEAGE